VIKFEFILDDLDAENLIYAIRETALRNDEYIMELEEKVRNGECEFGYAKNFIEWHKLNKEYLLGLIAKMSNTRISEG
jgi:hypothetical protein